MDLEVSFLLAGLLAMAGWVMLLTWPLIPHWSDKISGYVIPITLSARNVTLILFYPSDEGGGFGTLAEGIDLFANPNAMMAGWVHDLTFDLLIGAWMCGAASHDGPSFWLVAPDLPLTFLFGPAVFLAFSVVRSGARPKAV